MQEGTFILALLMLRKVAPSPLPPVSVPENCTIPGGIVARLTVPLAKFAKVKIQLQWEL